MKLKIFEWEIDLSEPRFDLRRIRMGFHDVISFKIPEGEFPIVTEDRYFVLLVPHEDEEEAKKLIRMAIKNAYASEYNRRKNGEKLQKTMRDVGIFRADDVGVEMVVKPTVGYYSVVVEFRHWVDDYEEDIEHEVVEEIGLTREQALRLAKYLEDVVDVLDKRGDADE